jgi:hypothetical protein
LCIYFNVFLSLFPFDGAPVWIRSFVLKFFGEGEEEKQNEKKKIFGDFVTLDV